MKFPCYAALLLFAFPYTPGSAAALDDAAASYETSRVARDGAIHLGEIGRGGAAAATAPATIQSATTPGGKPALHGLHKALLAIEHLSKPVIAAINGRAHGG